MSVTNSTKDKQIENIVFVGEILFTGILTIIISVLAKKVLDQKLQKKKVHRASFSQNMAPHFYENVARRP